MYKKFGLALICVLLILVYSGCSCKSTKQPITLKVWGTAPLETYSDYFDAFSKADSSVTIEYTQKTTTDYESELIDAIAGANGPDIFLIHDDWVPKHQDILAPMPAVKNAPKQDPKKLEVAYNLDQFKSFFAPVATQQLILNDQIYAMPNYIDTLALYYNQALIDKYNSSISNDNAQKDQLQIKQPADNWTDFVDQVKKLTVKSGTRVDQAGAVLGTADNTLFSQDILPLLMLQNGTDMTTVDNKSAAFNLPQKNAQKQDVYPGKSALDFYTSFALPSKETYSYNANIADPLAMFTNGQAAYMIGYASLMPQIKKNAPDFKYSVVDLPQIKGTDNPISYANYEAFGANARGTHIADAWRVIRFLTDKSNQQAFSSTNLLPPANVDLAKSDTNNEQLKPFSDGVPYAKSYYKGVKPEDTDQIFLDMINSIVKQGTSLDIAIDTGAARFTKLLRGDNGS